MNTPARHYAIHGLEESLGRLLRVGVSLAAMIVLLGGLIYLTRHGHDQPAYDTFRGEPSNLRTLSGIISGIGQWRGREIIQFGLLLLIATPIARVAFAAYSFARQRDWMYLAIASIVLSLLLYGLLSGGSSHFQSRPQASRSAAVGPATMPWLQCRYQHRSAPPNGVGDFKGSAHGLRTPGKSLSPQNSVIAFPWRDA